MRQRATQALQALPQRVQRWNRQWRELGARHRASNNPVGESQYQEDLRELRREGQDLRSEGGELNSNPDEDPPGPPASRPASERSSDAIPEQDHCREGASHEGRHSPNLNPTSHVPSERSGSREGSSGQSEDPPPSDPPSYHSHTPTYRTNASTAINPPGYNEQPSPEQQDATRYARRRLYEHYDRQRF